MKKPARTILYTLSLFFLLGAIGFSTPSIKMEKISFATGGFTVKGDLLLPEKEERVPLVIMVHGSGPGLRTYFRRIKYTILQTGYATLTWDKPGYGQSEGKFSKESLQQERAEILLEALHRMKEHPAVDPERIGLWGISQAGYVIPLALEKTRDIRFLIMVGCPGENGIQQSAYQIYKNLQISGMSESEARAMENHYIQIFYAQSFDDYIRHAKPLYDHPVQRKMGFVSALWDRDNWKPISLYRERLFNPMEVMKSVKIPTLVLFGEKDTQVDPIQGMKAYKKALTRAGNQNFRIELIKDGDHNLILCKTGSVEERRKRSSLAWSNYAPDYLRILTEWLEDLKPVK